MSCGNWNGCGCNQQLYGCGGGCTPFSSYATCSWIGGPCAQSGCGQQCMPFNQGCGPYNQTYVSCYPCGNPFWSFGCSSCGQCNRRDRDCEVKIITRERL